MLHSKGEIVVFPVSSELKKEIEKLRTEISMLLLEHDNVLYVECKNIEAAYMLAVGSLEYRALELDFEVRRLQRKIDLIQEKINRQENVVLRFIDAILDKEFADYQKELNKRLADLNDAIERYDARALSPEEVAEIKKLYRRIVKVLHPDLNPEISEAEKVLFFRATTAYERGDLKTMRLIANMTAGCSIVDLNDESVKVLEEERTRLQKVCKSLRRSIEDIKAKYPYSMKEFVQDEEQISEKNVELQETIAQLEELRREYQNLIHKMLEEYYGRRHK